MYSEQLTKPKSQPLVDKLQLNWYIFYTYPKSEKVVKSELEKRGYEVFLPTRKELKLWKNRQKKWIDQVLFTGYIFVNTHVHEIYKVIKTPKIVTYIHCGGVPSFLRIKEVEAIRKMISSDHDISIEANFNEGEMVRVVHGPLAGHEGILITQKGKTRFGIQLKEINHTVLIDICVSMLEKV